MANIKSAIKRIKVTETKTLRNKIIKSAVKTIVKKFEVAVNGGNFEEAKSLLPTVTKAIDKACAKGVLHKNTASRKKSNLTVKLNKVASK